MSWSDARRTAQERGKRRVKSIVKVLWLIACVVVLAVSCYVTDASPTNDADEFMAWMMILLSAPAGLLVPWIVGGAAYLLYSALSIVIAPAGFWYYVSLVVVWASFVTLGYLQWFKLVPLLIVRIGRAIRKEQ